MKKIKISNSKLKYFLTRWPAILFVIFIFFFSRQNWFLNTANSFQDWFYPNWSSSPDIVIAAIDDRSLQAIGAWPWSRDIFARFIDKANQAGARVIAFDILWSEPTIESDDLKLRAAIETSQAQIVLGTKILPDQSLLKPIENLNVSGKTSFGLATVTPDIDGQVRRVPVMRSIGTACVSNLGVAAMQAFYFATNSSKCLGSGLKLGQKIIPEDNLLVPYLGLRGTLKTVSIMDILEDKNQETFNSLNGAVVFVGSTVQDLKLGLDDNILSPKGFIPGVELHASIATAIRTGNFLISTSNLAQTLSAILAGLLGLWLGLWRRSWLGFFGLIFCLFSGLILTNWLAGNGIWHLIWYSLVALIGGWLLSASLKAFNQYQENLHLRQTFSRYTDKKLLSRILKHPEALCLGGEKVTATILFSDIRGFTSLSEQLDPHTLVSILNEYLSAATRVVFATDGVIDKYIGDAIMAHWNALVSEPDHSIKAVKAGLALKQVVANFNQSHPELKTPLAIGVGINTGEVIAGNLGSDQRIDFTVIGDEVNLASRLEGLTKQYRVSLIAGPATAKVARNYSEFRIRKLDLVRVKGKTQAIEIYEINNQTLSSAQIENYETAWNLYAQGDFISALALWKNTPTDGPSIVMAQRTETLLLKSPESWDGSWSWDQK